ncbi:MAG TPA: YceI family protein [Candidatus Acidoferrales bacterium]|nr:YceI family protein [Candidatus Acidoferrales bacterium]
MRRIATVALPLKHRGLRTYQALCVYALAALVIFFFPGLVISQSRDAQTPRAFSTTLDAPKTAVSFTLAATAHEVHGEFNIQEGHVSFDPTTGKLSGAIVVDARTGRTGNDSRDHRMHQEVLESDRYPEITFRPDLVMGTWNAQGQSHVTVQGRFLIHGTEHQINVPIDADCESEVCAIGANFTVPYVEWGMKNPSNFLLRVGRSVEIHFRTSIRIDSSQDTQR